MKLQATTNMGLATIVKHLRGLNLADLHDKLDGAVSYDRLREIALHGCATAAEATAIVDAYSDGSLRYNARNDSISRNAARTLRLMLASNSVSRIADTCGMSAFEIEQFIDGKSLAVEKMNRICSALGTGWRVDGDELVSTAATMDLPNACTAGNGSSLLHTVKLSRLLNF